MSKCNKCLNSRPIISENDYHFICCLSSKKAVDCITNTKDYFIPRSNIDINKILDDIEKLEVKENRKNEYSF